MFVWIKKILICINMFIVLLSLIYCEYKISDSNAGYNFEMSMSNANYSASSRGGMNVLVFNIKTVIYIVDEEILEEVVDKDLKDVFVYPNPFKAFGNDQFRADYLTFANLSNRVKVIIYNIAGEKVAEFIKNDPFNRTYKWKPENKYGRPLGRGVYIYKIINDKNDKFTGKFSIIR